MTDSALVSTEWLAAHLRDPELRVLDASWYLPSAGRDPRAEYADAHVPGARFFDVDAVADASSPLPHMLPSAEDFAAAMRGLGVREGDHVVVYDGLGVVSSARAWWTLRAFGHPRVSVLDGGLPKWRAEGRPVTDEVPTALPSAYRAELQPHLLAELDEVRRFVDTAPASILDARPRGRFEGTEPEPRPGLRGGHMPGARSLPWASLLTEAGTLAPRARLAELVRDSGVDTSRPVVTTCGSGITAAMLALALFELGHPDAKVYDGSWAEWGARKDTKVAEGPA